jgi:hypothetical protein
MSYVAPHGRPRRCECPVCACACPCTPPHCAADRTRRCLACASLHSDCAVLFCVRSRTCSALYAEPCAVAERTNRSVAAAASAGGSACTPEQQHRSPVTIPRRSNRRRRHRHAPAESARRRGWQRRGRVHRGQGNYSHLKRLGSSRTRTYTQEHACTHARTHRQAHTSDAGWGGRTRTPEARLEGLLQRGAAAACRRVEHAITDELHGADVACALVAQRNRARLWLPQCY